MSDGDVEGHETLQELAKNLRQLKFSINHLQSFVTDLSERLTALEKLSTLPRVEVADPFNSLGLVWTPFHGESAPILSSFALHTDLGRRSFLATLFWAYQKGGIIPATSHIWSNLADPKTARATSIGKNAGVSGRGKTAIRHTLERFLDDTKGLKVPEFPDRNDYENSTEWNRACIENFQRFEKSLNVYLVRYSVALNGGAA